MGVHFAALPMGHEFTSLLLALLWAGGHPPKVEPEVMEQIKAWRVTSPSTTWMSLTCHNCPDVVQALQPDGRAQPACAPRGHRRRPVPAGGGAPPDHGRAQDRTQRRAFASGRIELGEILAKIDTGAARREAAKLNEKAPFEVLIIGGGPAGAAAAVYAARKGIRTGIVAERFGGQTMDTLGIENFISVLETEGPKFAAALEAHVRHYGVDVMTLQRVALTPTRRSPAAHATVVLDNGAELKAAP
jgi:alkyl hydroperoxide reductase subunit F